MLTSAALDGVVLVFNSSDSRLLHRLDGPDSEIQWMRWHPRGPIIAVGCSDGTSWIWHVSTTSSTAMQVLSQDGAMTAGAFTGLEGKALCTGADDGSVRIWSCRSGQVTCQIRPGSLFHEDAVCALDTHPTQPIVLTGSQDNKVKWSHIDTGKVLGTVPGHKAPVEAVAFARPELGQNWAVSGDMDGAIFIIDLDRGTVRARVSHDDGIVKLAWLRQRPHLFCSCSLDGSVCLWDARTSTCVKRFRGHTGPVYDIAISADKRFIVSCSEDQVALVFPLEEYH